MTSRVNPSARLVSGILIGILCLLSLWLRCEGISFGLPFGDYADEAGIPATAVRILSDGDLNPHYFNYPPLTAYTIAAITGLALAIDHHVLSFLPDISLDHLGHLIGRLLSALYGSLIVLLVYLVTQQLQSRQIAVVAAALIAVQPTLVLHAHLATVDSAMIFWIMVATLIMTMYVKSGSMKLFYAAGVVTGIAAATKYNGIALLLPISLILLLRPGNGETLWAKTRAAIVPGILCSLLAIVTFLILAPYTVLDFDSFQQGFLWEMRHQRVGHYEIGRMGDSLESSRLWSIQQHLRTIYDRLHLPVVIALVVGLLSLISRRDYRQFLVFLIPLTLLFSISWSQNAPERYTMMLFPFLAIIAACGIVQPLSRIPAKNILVVLLSLIILIPLLHETATIRSILIREQTPQLVRDWFFRTIPIECGIASDIYAGVWIDGSRHDQVRLPSLTNRSGQWYTDRGISFLVCSSIIRDRDRSLYDRDPWRREFYGWLVQNCYHIKQFRDQPYDLLNPTIDVYLIRQDDRRVFSPLQSETNKGVEVSLSFTRIPPQRVNLLWRGHSVYNDDKQQARIVLPLSESSRQLDALPGILYFRGELAGEFEKIECFLSVTAIDDHLSNLERERISAPTGVSIIPSQGFLGPNEPLVFRIRQNQSDQIKQILSAVDRGDPPSGDSGAEKKNH